MLLSAPGGTRPLGVHPATVETPQPGGRTAGDGQAYPESEERQPGGFRNGALAVMGRTAQTDRREPRIANQGTVLPTQRTSFVDEDS